MGLQIYAIARNIVPMTVGTITSLLIGFSSTGVLHQTSDIVTIERLH
jgi:hypothetical protein